MQQRQGTLVVIGSIPVTGDTDHFRLDNVAAGSRAWLYTDTGGANVTGDRDTSIDIFGADGTTLLETDQDDGTGNGGDGTTETLNAASISGRELTAGGTYFIRVRGTSGTNVAGQYRLFIVIADEPINTETESNDSIETADQLIAGIQSFQVSGSIGTPTDVDFYSVQLLAAGMVFISLDGDPDRTGANTLDGTIQLFGTGGTPELMTPQVDSGPGGPGNSEAFAYLVPAAGTYYVRVAGNGIESGRSYRIKAATCQTVQGPGLQLSGRVLTPSGLGIRSATVKITFADGSVRTSSTSSFGVYNFSGIPAGASFVLTASSKRYRFAPQMLQLFASRSDADLVGLE